MHQHRQRYFHARHRRPSPAIKWQHAGTRQQSEARQTGTPRAATSQRRRQEVVPAEGHRPRAPGLAARPKYAVRRHGLAAASRELRQHPPRPAGIGHTPHRSLLRPSLRRHACDDRVGHLARTDPSPTPARTPQRVSRSKRPPVGRGQLPSGMPCMTYAVTDRNHGKARNGGLVAGIRNLRPFGIPTLLVRPSPAIRLLARRAGRGNAPPGHSTGAAERDAARTESARQPSPAGPGQPGHAIDVRSARTASNRPAPADGLPASREGRPARRPDPLTRQDVGAR